MDSLGERSEKKPHTEVIEYLNKERERLKLDCHFTTKTLPLWRCDVPQQSGIVDCGLYVLLFASYLSAPNFKPFKTRPELNSQVQIILVKPVAF
jgi:Ulp1 family protease